MTSAVEKVIAAGGSDSGRGDESLHGFGESCHFQARLQLSPSKAVMLQSSALLEGLNLFHSYLNHVSYLHVPAGILGHGVVEEFA